MRGGLGAATVAGNGGWVVAKRNPKAVASINQLLLGGIEASLAAAPSFGLLQCLAKSADAHAVAATTLEPT